MPIPPTSRKRLFPPTVRQSSAPAAADNSAQANNSDCPPTEKPADSSSLLTEWQKKWSQYFNDLQDANALDAAIAKLTAEVKLQPRESEEPRCETRAQQHAWRPYRPQHGRRKQRKQGGYDATEGSPIQKLYRRSRVRAIKAITEEDSPYCTVPLSDVHTHFSSIYKERELNDAAMPPEVPELHCKTQGDEDPFVENFTPGEVWARLYRCGNTSPGPDGIRYPQWKKADTGCHVLSTVFNADQRTQHVPTPWRKSSTILIHKKGDRLNLANWRPIALRDTIAKLYASVLAECLGRWAARNNRISTAQKGFRPVDGCSEHNLLYKPSLLMHDAPGASAAWHGCP